MAYRIGIRVLPWMLGLLVSSLAVAPLQAQIDIGEKVYQQTVRGVVWIVVPHGRAAAVGTGSLIDRERRLVITNFHVVGNAADALVLFAAFRDSKLVTEKQDYLGMVRSGAAIRGKVKAIDQKRDLAVIELQRVPPGARVVHLARQSPHPGQRVHSVGNPGRSDALWLYTSGTVRQVYHKKWRGKDHDKTFEFEAEVVETQSPTNPGDSGGPLVNDQGQLVAVTQGYAAGAQLLSLFIDVGEVKSFLASKGLLHGLPSPVARNGSTRTSPEQTADKREDPARKAEQLASSKLKLAKLLAHDGKLEKAKDRYEEIIEEYPKTEAAKEAKLLLDKLSK